MLENYPQIACAMQESTNRIQEDFSGNWLLHPGSSNLPTVDIPPDPDSAPHPSRLFEFAWVLDGDLFLLAEQKILQLTKGQIFLLPTGVLHTQLPGIAGAVCWFVFFPDRVWMNVSVAGEDGQPQLIHGQQVPIDPVSVSLLLKDISKELSSNNADGLALIKCGVLQLLLQLQRRLKTSDYKLSASQWRESVVKEILVYLRSCVGAPPDLNSLAEQFAISPNHLNSIFKAVTGKTVNAYCSDLRIRQAMHLLETTPIKLRELAEQLGYYDQYHFCKAFKKATGKSPSAYRFEKNSKDFT